LIHDETYAVTASFEPIFRAYESAGTCERRIQKVAFSLQCPANIVQTGASATRVDVEDLLAVIDQWGPCPAPPNVCPANIVNIGSSQNRVDVDDLLRVITAWGNCADILPAGTYWLSWQAGGFVGLFVFSPPIVACGMCGKPGANARISSNGGPYNPLVDTGGGFQCEFAPQDLPFIIRGTPCE
jgi:hypothetical protein